MKAIARLERWLFNPDHGGPTASALPRLMAGGTSCPEGACNDQMSSGLSDGLLHPYAAASVSPTTGRRSWATTLRGGLAPGAEHASVEDAKRGRRQIGTRDTDLAVSARVLSEHRVVLAVRGRLNAVTALTFKARIQEMVREGWREIVCDLGEVGSLDSSGLAALIAGVKAAHERGGFFKLVARNEHVTRLFELTKLDRVFEMHRSVEDALALDGDGDEISRVA